MSFVVDASMTMTWCFDDEATEATEAVLDQLQADGAITPAIWPLEVANILLVAERRGRITESQRAQYIRLLSSLPIMVEQQTRSLVFGAVLSVAHEHDLSAYDAAYLELAMRAGLPLATLDTRLREAAASTGVTIR
jgi:predicted nucleic acid-binding protein